jgi:serine O-acetyltransferase
MASWGGAFSVLISHYRRKYGLEIAFEKGHIGEGIRLIHPWNITVNDNAVLGYNVTLFKGSTIGAIDNGSKKGTPIIGDNVTLFANSTVCGNIRVGNNVEIAAGAFVNFDVPSNAIVIGNPGIIHMKKV